VTPAVPNSRPDDADADAAAAPAATGKPEMPVRTPPLRGGRLIFREADDSPASLAALDRFYDERYIADFPDPDERESLANMRRYLALKAQGWYGPNNYHILIAEHDGEPVGGAVFDFLAAPNAGVIEFLFVAAVHRAAGLGRMLLDEVIRILHADAGERVGQPLSGVFAEMNDPFRRPATPDNLDPFRRAAIWGRWGFGVLDFPYVQPALSPGQARVDCLVLIARLFGEAAAADVSSAWVKLAVAEYLRWAMRIDEPADSPDFRMMSDFLDARARIGLRPLQHYIGHDPLRGFVVEEIPDVGGAADASPGFRAAIALAHDAIPVPGRVASTAQFAAALAARHQGGPAYHLWALRAPGSDAIEGMASFFSLPSTGFGGYVVLAGALRGRRLLRLLAARIEAQMLGDGTKADGWFVECGAESAAAFLRIGFAEVPLDYRPPPVGDARSAQRRPPERLYLLYKPFGGPRATPALETSFVLRALREILAHVYDIASPHRHACYRLARRSLATASLVVLPG